MFDVYIIDVWWKKASKNMADLWHRDRHYEIRAGTSTTRDALEQNKSSREEHALLCIQDYKIRITVMDFVKKKKRVWNNRVRFVTFASEMDQQILRAWTTPANCSTRTICYPRVDWPNSTLFTSIFLQFDILKQCLCSKRSVTGCRFQKKSFRPVNWKRG